MREEILALADERLQSLLRQADSEDLVGYLLVDLSIDRWTQGSILPIHRRGASRSLFQGKPEEGFSAIAPHLMALDMLTDEEWQKIMAQDIELAAFSWLWIDETARDDLFSHLQKQLDMRLSDGGVALLRYYDPRVFTKLMRLLDEDQRQTLFGPIRYWSVCIMNERQVFQPTDAIQEAIS